MTPQEFKRRYLLALDESSKLNPYSIKQIEQFREFTTFPLELMEDLQLSLPERTFLHEAGLPRVCAPYLNFYNLYEAEPDLKENRLSEDFFLIGSASRKRLIGIVKDSGEVVCLELLEQYIEILLMNSSLEKLAECLCIFAQYTDKTRLDEAYADMCRIDSQLEEEENFWQQETSGFLDNVLNALNQAARENQ
jgi:hypothetical protein